MHRCFQSYEGGCGDGRAENCSTSGGVGWETQTTPRRCPGKRAGSSEHSRFSLPPPLGVHPGTDSVHLLPWACAHSPGALPGTPGFGSSMRLVSGPSPQPCCSRAVQCEKFQGPGPHGKLWPPKTRAASSPKLRELGCRIPKKLGCPPPTHRTAWVWEKTQNRLPQEPDKAGLGEGTARSSPDQTPGRSALRLRAHRLRSLGGS